MKAKMTVYADQIRNQISRNLYGHFMEHAFGNIYGGVYQPGHPLADEDGFRTDVLEALRDVHIPVLRYPGGNFVSNYHWEDGIGDKKNRRRVFEYSWLAEESNQFGTIDFIKLCRKIGAEPYICTNMGTGTIEEAMHWVEFCNGTGNTYYANWRRSLGYEEPFHVKYWGLGNEMFGGWQLGFLPADQYAQKAVEFGKAMKWVDPTIELIACGYELDSEWNSIVAGRLKSMISGISAHHYSTGWGIFDKSDYEQCMYIPEYINKMTDIMRAGIITGTNDALTDIKIFWDEWNVNGWEIEGVNNDETYTLQDAVLTAAIMHTFIRRSDIVAMANYSPFINISGALSVHDKGIVKRSQYSAFELFTSEMGDQYLNSHVECDMFELEEKIDYTGRKPEPKLNLSGQYDKRKVKTPYIDCVAACDSEQKTLTLSLINKHPQEDCQLDLAVLGRDISLEGAKCWQIYADDIHAANTLKQPDRVTLQSIPVPGDIRSLELKKHSVTLLKVKMK